VGDETEHHHRNWLEERRSALWMRDIVHIYGLACQIHSVDVVPVVGIEIPGVTFHTGDGRGLAKTFDNGFLRRLARPLLVIEDADHRPETTYAVLKFFDSWMRPGEYIVVEDGIVNDMGHEVQYAGGPLAAMARFLTERGKDYEIDRRYCDWFGGNVTWNVDGFLRRRPRPVDVRDQPRDL